MTIHFGVRYNGQIKSVVVCFGVSSIVFILKIQEFEIPINSNKNTATITF